jgi:hypothetical protein
MGGEGVVLVGQSCGSIRPSEKVKIGKGAKSPLSRYEKKEVLAQGVLGRILPRANCFNSPSYYAPTVITLAY